MKINYVSKINVTFKTINKVNKKISHIVHFTFNDSLISLVERSSMQNSWVCVEIFQYMKRNVSYIIFMKKCLVSLLLSYIVMRLFRKKSKKKIKRVLNLGTNLWELDLDCCKNQKWFWREPKMEGMFLDSSEEFFFIPSISCEEFFWMAGN